MTTQIARPRRCLQAAALLGALSLCGVAFADGKPARKFGDSTGLVVKFNQGEPMSDLPMLLDLHVRWVRETVHWPTLEPVAGTFKPFPADFQQRLAFYRKHDIGLVFFLGYDNPTAYPSTPEKPFNAVDPVAFGRYAAEVTRQLKASGVRFILEVWNEPHNFVLRKTLGGAWNGEPPAPWVDHYVRIVKEVVKQVKALDPAVTVISNDDMWVIHYWFLEAGLPPQLDGFGFHPYTKNPPEVAAVARDTVWGKPFEIVDDDRSFSSAVRRLRERGRVKLGKTPEMWITEWGWGIGVEASPFGPVTEELLAAFVPRAYIAAQAAGVKATCWFSSRDSVDGPMGLTTNDGRKRRPYLALKAMGEQLGDYTFAGQVLGAKQPTAGVQAYLFTGSKDRKLAIWTIDDSTPARLRLTGALRDATAVDVFGAELKPQRDDAGTAYLPLGRAPIYIKSGGQAPIKPDMVDAAGVPIAPR